MINDFEFDICTYYDIIDSLNEIEKIYHKYSYGIELAIKSENLTFYQNITNKFEDEIDPLLKYIEYISDMMKNNKSIIEGHKVFYGDEYGDQRRIESIERIDSIRGKIENIINEIFNKNELIYEKIIKNLSERIKEEDYEQIYEDANKLINFLEEKKLIEFA